MHKHMNDWYVIRTRSGQEDNVIDVIDRKISKSLYKDIWSAYRYDVRKKQGQEYILRVNMYPGYVFINTDHPDEIDEFLDHASDFDGLLQTGDYFAPIDENDKDIVEFFARTSGEISISKGIIVNGKTKIESGPLMGYEDQICKIDRHKRKAWVKFGDERKVIFSLEITEKIEE